MNRTTSRVGGASLSPPGTGQLAPRRSILTGLTAGLILCAMPAFAHGNIGPVKPSVQVPDIDIISSDGFRGPLREQLLGRVTAVQLMFTKCRSICPIEAATFVRTQEALASNSSDGIQLLSLSIDPITDTPDVLAMWLEGLNAQPGWIAASPGKADLTRARQFFDSASGLGEDHSTSMSLIDRAGLLVWRTSELPAPEEVAKMLRHL